MAQAYTSRCRRAGMIVAIMLGISFILFGRPLSSLYTNDEACIAICVEIFWIVAFIQPFQSSQFIVSGALRGAGDTEVCRQAYLLYGNASPSGSCHLRHPVSALGTPGRMAGHYNRSGTAGRYHCPALPFRKVERNLPDSKWNPFFLFHIVKIKLAALKAS